MSVVSGRSMGRANPSGSRQAHLGRNGVSRRISLRSLGAVAMPLRRLLLFQQANGAAVFVNDHRANLALAELTIRRRVEEDVAVLRLVDGAGLAPVGLLLFTTAMSATARIAEGTVSIATLAVSTAAWAAAIWRSPSPRRRHRPAGLSPGGHVAFSSPIAAAGRE